MEAGAQMETYERTGEMGAPADEVFAFLSDAHNLPKYLPPIHDAEPEQDERVHLHGQGPDGDPIDSEGYMRVDRQARHIEWGSDTARKYSGWLDVSEAGSGASTVTVHLEFGPRSIKDEIDADTPDDVDPMHEAIGATLESIRRQVEGEGGKVSPEELPGG